jgi:hypothetical protein
MWGKRVSGDTRGDGGRRGQPSPPAHRFVRGGFAALEGARRLLYPRGVRLVVAIALSLLAGGCATILPFERERLAQPDMQLASSPELSLAEGHATEVREGAVGGMGGAGGGCGCN